MRDRIQRGWTSPGWINYLLLPVSWAYLASMAARKLLYDVGIFRTQKLDAPVIVVGGISAGGSGKTPLVIALAKYLNDNGYRPGVISRGYRGSSTYWPRQVTRTTTADVVGDEPQLIYELAGVPVVVGPDRLEDGRMLIEENGCDVIVSDDGFQHFRLHRDLDIVVIDGQAGFGNGWCLPSGPLREPASAIRRAGIVVFNSADKAGFPMGALWMSMSPGDCYNLVSGEPRSLESFKDSTAHAVAGIGNPERFFMQLQEAGITVYRHAFIDHHRFVQSDLDFADGAPVLMTEKDGVKCRNMESVGHVWIVRAQVELEPAIFRRIDEAITHTDNTSRR